MNKLFLAYLTNFVKYQMLHISSITLTFALVVRISLLFSDLASNCFDIEGNCFQKAD